MFIGFLFLHNLCCISLGRGKLFHLLLAKEKEREIRKTRRQGGCSPVWGGVIRVERITDPITITTEWFCIAFCGINWLVPKDTHRNPLTTVVGCDSFGSSWILLGQAENIWLVSFFSMFSMFFLVWSSLGCGFPFSRGRLVKRPVISIHILFFGFP